VIDVGETDRLPRDGEYHPEQLDSLTAAEARPRSCPGHVAELGREPVQPIRLMIRTGHQLGS
jgi:hypothetical protein